MVSFVARLCGMRNQQAAARINEDFCLGLNLGEPPSYREQKEWEQKEFHRKEEEMLEKTGILGSFSLPAAAMACPLWSCGNTFVVGVVGAIGNLRLLFG